MGFEPVIIEPEVTYTLLHHFFDDIMNELYIVYI